MSIEKIYLGSEPVVYMVKDGLDVYNARAERLKRNLKLWIAGLDDYTDRSPMQHSVTLVGDDPTSVNDGLSFRNATWLDYPNDLGYVDQVSSMTWFRHVGPPDGNHHIVFGGPQLEISIFTEDYLRCGLYINGTRYVYNHKHPTKSLLDGQWHHVGFTYDGTDMRWYIDGDKVGTETPPAGVLTSNFSLRHTGKFGANVQYGLNADVFDLRVYSDVKDDEFFLRHYNEIDMSTVRRMCEYRSNALR